MSQIVGEKQQVCLSPGLMEQVVKRLTFPKPLSADKLILIAAKAGLRAGGSNQEFQAHRLAGGKEWKVIATKVKENTVCGYMYWDGYCAVKDGNRELRERLCKLIIHPFEVELPFMPCRLDQPIEVTLGEGKIERRDPTLNHVDDFVGVVKIGLPMHMEHMEYYATPGECNEAIDRVCVAMQGLKK